MPRIHKQLLSYSAAAATFILINSKAEGQVIYHDIDPDTLIDHDQVFNLDFNNDGITDIRFKGSNTSFETFTSDFHEYSRTQKFYIDQFDAVVKNTSYAISFGAKNLHSGYLVGASDSWNTNDEINLGSFQKFEFGWYSNFSTLYTYNYNWLADGQYLGVRFQIDGVNHYGWVRLTLSDLSQYDYQIPKLIIQDYEFEVGPETDIAIENPTASIATDLLLLDAGETGTVSDLKLSFRKAEHEETVSAYRVFLYKYAYPALPRPLEIDSLLNLPADRYTEILPTGSDIEMNFNDATLDIAGNSVVVGYTRYKAVVLSLADGALTTIPNISIESNAEDILIRSTGRVEYISITDPWSTGNTSDFEVSFKKAFYEGDIKEYRAFIINEDDYFSEDYLNSLDSTYYAAFIPDGSENYIISFSADDKIVGEIIPGLFENYYAFVISKLDSASATYFGSNESNYTTSFYYSPYPEAPVVSIDNHTGTPADIHVQFNKLENEWNMDEYRIFLVEETELPVFDEDYAANATEGNYMQVLPIGENINLHLSPVLKDCLGNFVDPAKTYYVFIALLDPIQRASISFPSEPVQIMTSIADEIVNMEMICYENILSVNDDTGASYQIHIYNASGAIVFSESASGNSKTDLNNLPSGVYLVQLTENNNSRILKINIIHHE